jgi:uncharacterized protein (DUF924 family)
MADIVGAERGKEILKFWFGSPQDDSYGQSRPEWFRKDPDYDAQIRSQFLADVQRAAAGDYSSWRSTAPGSLALILLLDQMPRNLYRGESFAFASDGLAREVARGAIAASFDQLLLPVQRWFMYLPFEHSEDWADQEQSLTLWATLSDHPPSADPIVYAQRHADVIRRFGRFPHRNEILGRVSTSEEVVFLQEPGSSF